VAAGYLYGILRLPAAQANTRTPVDVQTRLVRKACCGKPVADDTPSYHGTADPGAMRRTSKSAGPYSRRRFHWPGYEG